MGMKKEKKKTFSFEYDMCFFLSSFYAEKFELFDSVIFSAYVTVSIRILKCVYMAIHVA